MGILNIRELLRNGKNRGFKFVELIKFFFSFVSFYGIILIRFFCISSFEWYLRFIGHGFSLRFFFVYYFILFVNNYDLGLVRKWLD